MTTVHQARQALGDRLRQLRIEATLNGKQFADRAGWQASKVSKIELGKQTPTAEDIAVWADICGAGPSDRAAVLNMLSSLETFYSQWPRRLRIGLAEHQKVYLDIESQTSDLRVFDPAVVPGLLQTADYAAARLSAHGTYSEPELEAAVAVRMRRQEVLYRSGRTFGFVITESVLRLGLAPAAVMLGQLDRLAVLTTQSNLQLGIVPFGVHNPLAPLHGFLIYDNRFVLIETTAAQLQLTQQPEIAVYRRAFQRHAHAAVYRDRARDLIADAAETWRPSTTG